MFEGYHYVEKNGQGAKKRFENPDTIRTIYEKLSTDDLPDANRRAKIKKLYNGNLPYNPRMLEQSGLKNLTNVNFLGMKGVIDNRADAILKIAQDTANLIELRPIARDLAGPDAEKIGAVVAEEWSTMARENPRFVSSLVTMNKEADLYGIGPITWPSSIDYCPVALERAQIRFVGNGPVVSSEHELFMFETTITAGYLRFLLDNEEMAAAEGWNVAEVKKWLIEVYYNGAETKHQPGFDGSTTAVEEAISMIRRNAIGEEQQFQNLYVIHAFVKETAWPRGITHVVIPSQGQSKFLFEKQNAYRTMDECFLWFPYSVKERYAKEVRGLASYLYPIEKLNNRFLCQIVDSAFRASSLVLAQQNQGVQSQQLTISEQGLYTVLPAGITPAPQQFNPNFQQLVGVKQLLDQVGTGSVSGTDKGPVGTTGVKAFSGGSQGQTKAEVELQQHLKAHRDEAEFAQRQDVLNKIFRESFKRSLRLVFMNPVERVDFPEIDDFINRCAMRGVTLEQMMVIPQLFSVVVCRDLALGSDGKVNEMTGYIQLYGGTLDENGRKYLARQHAKLRFGQGEADRIIPEVSRDQAPSDQSSFATLENNMMKQGLPAQVGQDQLHWSHIPVHAQVLQEIVEQVRAPEDNQPKTDSFGNPEQNDESIGEQTLQNVQGDPKRVLNVLMLASQHIQEHLQIGGMQIGMQDRAKQVTKMLRDLRPTVKALNLAVATQERVEQAQREAQEREMQALQEQASQAEVEKAKYKIDRDTEIARYRADQEHDVALRKLELEGQRGASADAIAERRAAGDEARRERESASKVNAQEEMTKARINAANAVNRFDVTNTVTGQQSVSPTDVMGGGEEELNFMSL